MAYRIEASSNGCYEGTTCLINKLGIRDEELLAQTESAYTLARASYLELHPLAGDFDLAHYQSLHRFLCSDLYEFSYKAPFPDAGPCHNRKPDGKTDGRKLDRRKFSYGRRHSGTPSLPFCRRHGSGSRRADHNACRQKTERGRGWL